MPATPVISSCPSPFSSHPRVEASSESFILLGYARPQGAQAAEPRPDGLGWYGYRGSRPIANRPARELNARSILKIKPVRTAVFILFASAAFGQQYEIGANIGYGIYRDGSIYSASGTLRAGIRDRFAGRHCSRG